MENSVLIPKIEVPTAEVQKPKKRLSKKIKVLLGISLSIILLLIALGIYSYVLYQKGIKLYKSALDLKTVGTSQDFGKIKSQITTVRGDLRSFQSTFKFISWAKILPFVGGYISDTGHGIKAADAGLDTGDIVLSSIDPYKDLLGFSTTDGEKTAQERIDFIIKSLPNIAQNLDAISVKVEVIQQEFSQINADRYPSKYKLRDAQEILSEATKFLVNAKPVIENAPYLLGLDSPRTYFVLFQNDKEIRPTGGFMTAYSIMKVDKAKFEPVLSDDIYNLDAKYKPTQTAPDPIIKYIKGPYVLSNKLRLRDMNWSPDFGVSMKDFSTAIASAGIKNVDGIIAVDTGVLEKLLGAIGPIGVPGFGNFSTAIDPKCNCAQVIQALEAYADVEGPIVWDPNTGKIVYRPKNSENRKKIIGPLMNSILANVMGQPKDKLSVLSQAVFDSVMQKDVMFYVYDEKVQKSLSDFGMAGKIVDYDGDYLHINDANLGGRKSNLYVTEDVNQEIKIGSDGIVTKILTITYKNPVKQDGWLNSILPNWVRVYVPKGSKLVSSSGLEAKQEPYEDLGKTVFAGYLQVRPEGLAKVTIEYTLPMKFKNNYHLLIQKQPGAGDFLYTVILGRHEEEFPLTTDKEIKIGI